MRIVYEIKKGIAFAMPFDIIDLSLLLIRIVQNTCFEDWCILKLSNRSGSDGEDIALPRQVEACRSHTLTKLSIICFASSKVIYPLIINRVSSLFQTKVV